MLSMLLWKFNAEISRSCARLVLKKHYTHHLSIAFFIPNQETSYQLLSSLLTFNLILVLKGLKNLAISVLSQGLGRLDSLDILVLHNYKHRSPN